MQRPVPLTDVGLFVATQEQVIECRSQAFHEWGRGLTLQQYLDREARLEKLEQAADHKLTAW